MGSGILNSSNDIIYGDMDEIPPDQDKVSGDIETENKINDYDMEISKDDGKDTEVYSNIKSDLCSVSRKHEVLITMN